MVCSSGYDYIILMYHLFFKLQITYTALVNQPRKKALPFLVFTILEEVHYAHNKNNNVHVAVILGTQIALTATYLSTTKGTATRRIFVTDPRSRMFFKEVAAGSRGIIQDFDFP